MVRAPLIISPPCVCTKFTHLLKLIICCLRSSQYPYFIVDKGPKKERTRASFNLIILGHKGIGKSSLLGKITQKYSLPFINDFTVPGLIGTVDKNGEVASGAFWRYRRRCILFDEFCSPSILRTINCAIEQGEISRSLGYAARNFQDIPNKEEEKEGLYARLQRGEITFKTRFSIICFALRHPLYKGLNPDVDAFCSRTIVVEWCKSLDERWKELEHGHTEPKFPPINIPCKKAHAPLKISKKDWKQILTWCKTREMSDENLERCVLDIARYRAISGWDEEIFDIIRRSHLCKAHKAKKEKD